MKLTTFSLEIQRKGTFHFARGKLQRKIPFPQNPSQKRASGVFGSNETLLLSNRYSRRRVVLVVSVVLNIRRVSLRIVRFKKV